MKTPSRIAFPTGLVALTCLCLGASSASAQSTLINVQFGYYSSPYTGAAIVGAAGDYWNDMVSETGTTSALNDNTNLATGVSLTYTGYDQWGGTGSSGFSSGPYAGLMEGYITAFGSVNPGHFTFSGLTANATIELWLYAQGDIESNGRQVAVSANGGTPMVTAPTNATLGTFVDGTNYLHITTTANAEGVLDLSYAIANLSGYAPEADVNGMQLIVTVPEPSTAAMLGLGALACLRRSRRRI